MDAKGVDRPVALVLGPPCAEVDPEVDAAVDRLLASGHQDLLAAAVATRRPLVVAVLAADRVVLVPVRRAAGGSTTTRGQR